MDFKTVVDLGFGIELGEGLEDAISKFKISYLRTGSLGVILSVMYEYLSVNITYIIYVEVCMFGVRVHCTCMCTCANLHISLSLSLSH